LGWGSLHHVFRRKTEEAERSALAMRLSDLSWDSIPSYFMGPCSLAASFPISLLLSFPFFLTSLLKRVLETDWNEREREGGRERERERECVCVCACEHKVTNQERDIMRNRDPDSRVYSCSLKVISRVLGLALLGSRLYS